MRGVSQEDLGTTRPSILLVRLSPAGLPMAERKRGVSPSSRTRRTTVTRLIYDDPEDKRPSWLDESRAQRFHGVVLARLICVCRKVVGHVERRTPDPDSPAAKAGVVGPVLVWDETDLYIKVALDNTIISRRFATRTFADPLSNVGTPQHPVDVPYTIACRSCHAELEIWPNRPEFRSQLATAEATGKVARVHLERAQRK